MLNNPEFQRQLWLNWRPSLALWTLLLCSLILALPLVLSDAHERLASLGLTAVFGLWASTTGYASVLAARSLSEEVRQHTWDWQRLSALTPWQMAWGKLLGATVPAWLYAALFGVTSVVAASVWELLWGAHRAWHLLMLAVLWGLATQAWAMNAVLVRWHAGPWQQRSLWLLALIGLPLVLGLVRALPSPEHHPWWGWDLGDWGLAYVLGLAACGLGLLALWRQLCERLDVPTLPWAWPVGLVVAGVASAGVWHTQAAALWPHLAGWALVATAFIGLQHMAGHARAWSGAVGAAAAALAQRLAGTAPVAHQLAAGAAGLGHRLEPVQHHHGGLVAAAGLRTTAARRADPDRLCPAGPALEIARGRLHRDLAGHQPGAAPAGPGYSGQRRCCSAATPGGAGQRCGPTGHLAAPLGLGGPGRTAGAGLPVGGVGGTLVPERSWAVPAHDPAKDDRAVKSAALPLWRLFFPCASTRAQRR